MTIKQKNMKMMEEKYFISSRPRTDGMYSIHREGCPFLPGRRKHILLGTFQSGKSAFEEGQKYFKAACLCRFCLKEHYQEKGFIIIPGAIRMSGIGSRGILNDSERLRALVCCKN